MNTFDRQRPQAIAAYNSMLRHVRGGQYGPDASICSDWLDYGGFENFLAWFKRFNPAYTASVSKDLLGKTNLFSPDTCTVVPSRFLNWFHKAIMRYSISEGPDGWSARFHSSSGGRPPHYFPSKEAAENDWRQKMELAINYYRATLDASDKRIYPRCLEIAEAAIKGEEDPLIFFSRRELRNQ